MNLDQIVALVVDRVYLEHLTATEASAKILADHVLTPEAAAGAQQIGIAALANQQLSRDRNGPADIGDESEKLVGGARSGRFQQRTDHGTEGAGAYYHLASTLYQCADGEMRALLAFTAEDWAHNANVAAARRRGWQQLQELFELGLEELGTRKVATSALPKAALERLEVKAAEVFGRRGARAVAV